MNSHNKPALILFTKVPGAVPCKTRLLESSPLTAEEVDRLARAMIIDVLITVAALNPECAIVASDPVLSPQAILRLADDLPFAPSLEELQKLTFLPQPPEPFGRRLAQACLAAQASGSAGCLTIGSDCVTSTPQALRAALAAVAAGEWVLGPTPEGGLYAIGIPNSAFCTEEVSQTTNLFESGFSSSEQTELEIFANSVPGNRSLQLLGVETDVDVAVDLITLRARLLAMLRARPEEGLAQNTAALLGLVESKLSPLPFQIARTAGGNRTLRLMRTPS